MANTNYTSQIQNLYYGATDVGAQRPGDESSLDLVKSLQSFTSTAMKGVIQVADEGKKAAAAELRTLLLSKSPDQINAEMKEGAHPNLQGEYTKSVIDNNYGMYDAGQFVAELQKRVASGEFDYENEDWEEWVTGQMPEEFTGKTIGYQTGFNGIATPYFQQMDIKYSELRGVHDKKIKFSNLATTIDVTDSENVHSVIATFQKDFFLNDGTKASAWNNTLVAEFSKHYVTTRLQQATTQEEITRLEQFLTLPRVSKDGKVLPSLASTRHPWISEAVGKLTTKRATIAATRLKLIDSTMKSKVLEHQLNWLTYTPKQKEEATAELDIIIGSKKTIEFLDSYDAGPASSSDVKTVTNFILNNGFASREGLEDFIIKSFPQLNASQRENLLKRFDDLKGAGTLLEDPSVKEFVTSMSSVIKESHAKGLYGMNFAEGASATDGFKDDVTRIISDLYETTRVEKGRGPTNREVRKALLDFKKEIYRDKLYLGARIVSKNFTSKDFNEVVKENTTTQADDNAGKGNILTYDAEALKENFDKIKKDDPGTKDINELAGSFKAFVEDNFNIDFNDLAGAEILVDQLIDDNVLMQSFSEATGVPLTELRDLLTQYKEGNL
mgnify:CR=1 FL=1|tara:strand:+ start:1580 stop:3415 length:1836 start_codon:yes stop_codon:yes gene_type:complete